jgi:hypothetical protein
LIVGVIEGELKDLELEGLIVGEFSDLVGLAVIVGGGAAEIPTISGCTGISDEAMMTDRKA